MTLERPYSKPLEHLSSVGLRPTSQRMILAKLLFDGTRRHVTAEMLHNYCSTVEYWQSGYVNLAIREFHQVLSNKYGHINLTSCSRNDYYYRPPIIDRRVQVSGWIRDKYISDGIQYLVVGTLAIDDIGTEILKTQETFSLGINPPPHQSIADVESQPIQQIPA